MKIKFILVYYTSSKYFGMKKQHIMFFNNMNKLVEYRERHDIENYEIYRQVI